MWTLLVIVYLGISTLTAATSVTVAGFRSKAACDLAGKEVTSQLHRADVEVVCVFLGGGAKVAAPPVLPALPALPAPTAAAPDPLPPR